MTYENVNKEINRLRNNVRYWGIAIRKKFCADLAKQLKEALESLKALISKFTIDGYSFEERLNIVTIRKEIAELEQLV